MATRRTTITSSPRPAPAEEAGVDAVADAQASTSSTTSSVTGRDWQASAKPASTSSGSS